MKRYLIVACVLLLTAGCASGTKKRFTVMTDPSDAVIRVVSGSSLSEDTYRSPAKISVRLPKDSVLLARNIIEVSRDLYKTRKIQLRDIRDDEVLTIKLDKLVRYALKYRLLGPAQSDVLAFQDTLIAVSFTVSEQSFQMNLRNLARQDLKILWDRADYTDVFNRQHRLMHSGIKYQDRGNLIPAQMVPAGGSVQEAVIPVGSVFYSQETRRYELKPLFTLDSEAASDLKGRVFYLFLPVEVNRQIIPYNFKIQITEAVKQGA